MGRFWQNKKPPSSEGTKANFRGTTLFFAKEQTLLRHITVPAVAA